MTAHGDVAGADIVGWSVRRGHCGRKLHVEYPNQGRTPARVKVVVASFMQPASYRFRPRAP